VITIVGVGALGSHAALFLRNEVSMRMVDFDRVEAKNTQAQFHTMMSLGKNKADALQKSLLGLFKVESVSSPYRLTELNSENILKGSKLVVDCTDNIQARKVISDACKAKKLPLLHGALAASGDFARVIWEEHFVPDAESGEGATCEDGEHLPFFAYAAASLAVEVQSFLRTGKKRSWQLTPSGILRLA
jgi:molybdopterin/thiamine biosynthesis adenylyltransferase